MRSRTAIAIASLLLPLTAAAQLQPVGPAFQVNTFTGYGQGYPAVAGSPDGAFVAAWVAARDGDSGGVFAQRFDSAGQALGTEFQVNSYTVDYQGRPAVAMAADGAFVVVWRSEGQDGDGRGVFGQHYDSAGQPAGSEFQANSYTQAAQSDDFDPAVAMRADGSSIVTWASDGQDGDGLGVFAQRYDSAGQPAGSEFLVNSYTIGTEYGPAVAVGADGAFMVTWMTADRDGNGRGIFGQRFDSMGQAVGAEFQVNSYTLDSQDAPEVAAGAAGGFVVTWTSQEQDGDGEGIFGQRYDSGGQAVGAEFQVNSYTLGSQNYTSPVAVDPDGAFMVVWRENRDGDGEGVFGRHFNNAGQAQGADFQVNSYTLGGQYLPSVAAGPGGSFVVAWQDEGQQGVFAQRFEAPTTCGNNVLGPGEECDDGNTVDGDSGCDSNCTFTACGNGITTSGEECDDGNTTNGDGCSSICEDSAPPENATDPTFTAGETLSSDTEADGATEEDPVETSITMSVGTASATIAESTAEGPTVPGYSFFGQLVEITVDCPGAPCPSASAPLVIEFRIDASRVPSGVNENTFDLFRDGILVPACTGAPGVASPDPCVDDRQLFIDGDIGAIILTSLASEWGFAASTCSPTVLPCGDPSKAIFQVKKTTGDPSKTKLLWKWLKGTVGAQSDFGNPVAGTSYDLCVYDGAALVGSHAILPGGDCGGSPCWKALGTKGFKYKNSSGNADGITKVLLKSGQGNAKILVKGKGANVLVPDSDPIYAQAPDLTVQLVSSGGGCWEAVYPSPATSTAQQFKDKMP